MVATPQVEEAVVVISIISICILLTIYLGTSSVERTHSLISLMIMTTFSEEMDLIRCMENLKNLLTSKEEALEVDLVKWVVWEALEVWDLMMMTISLEEDLDREWE